MKTFKTMKSQALRMPAPKDRLNPKLWMEDRNQLRPEIHNLLLVGAVDFVLRLGISSSMIDDIRIVGGNAGYNYTDASDLDVTLMLSRDTDLSKEEVRNLQISANNITYRYRPTIEGIDLNFYMSSRNVGSLRPARQSIYSLEKQEFLIGPTKSPEISANFLASKANFFLELIEECVDDDTNDADECAGKLLKTLKQYRVKGLASKQGEESTENLVWRILSTSGYIKMLKTKMDELEKNFYQLKTPSSVIRNEEYKLLIKEGTGVDTIPASILKYNKKLLLGQDIMPMIKRVKPIIALFLCMNHGLPLTDHRCSDMIG